MTGVMVGVPGVDLMRMTPADKRRGGSKATTPRRPQQTSTNNPKSTRGSVQPRPQTRGGGNTSR